jgi:hypothetical protein
MVFFPKFSTLWTFSNEITFLLNPGSVLDRGIKYYTKRIRHGDLYFKVELQLSNRTQRTGERKEMEDSLVSILLQIRLLREVFLSL